MEDCAPRVFISYVRQNIRRVRRLVTDLEAAGIEVLWDENIPKGRDWQRWIRENIEGGDFFVPCFSKQYWARAESGETYMNVELDIATEKMRGQGLDRVWCIPVRLDRCEVPDYDIGGKRALCQLNWVGLFGAEARRAKGVQELADTVRPEEPLPARMEARRVLLRRGSVGDRRNILDQMWTWNTEKARRLRADVEACFREGPENVTWAASIILARLMVPEAAPATMEALQRGRNVRERRSAAIALGVLRTPKAVEVLTKALRCDESDEVRQAAARSLRSIGTPEAVRGLCKALKSDNGKAAREAAKLLGRIGTRQAVRALRMAVKRDDGDIMTRIAALQALRRSDTSEP